MESKHSIEGLPERALLVFFRGPGLEFSRRLRASLDRDPCYVEMHRTEVYHELERYLGDAGIAVDEQRHDSQLQHVIREVVVRLRSYERGGRL
jgi:hypothetical protein